jgi:hypothetical protein
VSSKYSLGSYPLCGANIIYLNAFNAVTYHKQACFQAHQAPLLDEFRFCKLKYVKSLIPTSPFATNLESHVNAVD